MTITSAPAERGAIRVCPLAPTFGVTMFAAGPAQALDEVGTADVRRLYRDAGAVLLRGFTVDTAAFDRFASRLIAECVVNGADVREDVAADRGIQTVNSGNAAIPLHAEMAYSPFRPDLLCFHCMQQPAVPSTGETLLADGVELWRRMPAKLRTIFDGASVRYAFRRNRMIGAQARAQSRRVDADPRVRRFQLHDDGTADLEFVVPAVQAVRDSGALAFANSVIVEADSASIDGRGPIGATVRQELFVFTNAMAHRLAWNTGDVLVVDNSRVMHGRRKIAANDGRRIAIKMGWEERREEPVAWQ